MKFFKKFAAVLSAMAMFTVSNIGILPRDAVEDFMLSVRATNTDIVASGECGADGDNLTWTLDSEGTLTISGEGEMKDYYKYDDYVPWFDYIKSITTVIIEDDVTSIGKSAFYNCDSLTSITIPDSITSIGESAFSFTPWLDEKRKENPLVIVSDILINGTSCEGNVTIPNNVTSISERAFYCCSKLKSITIPDSVTSIGGEAFSGCDSLTSVTIPDSVTSIGGYAFSFTPWLDEKMEENPLVIVNGILIDGGIACKSDVVIPESITSIGDYAFNDRYSQGCYSLTSITISNSVTSIGDCAFYSCDSLTDVYYSGSEEEWNSINIGDFNENLTNATIHYNYNSSETDIIYSGTCGADGDNLTWTLDSEGTLTISGEGKMDDCPEDLGGPWFNYVLDIKKIVISDSVTSIGDWAFYSCTALTSITIPDSITSIGAYAFCHCTALTSTTIPDSVTKIEDNTFFACYALTSITIPDSVTSIGRFAFIGCIALTSITIPDSVISIGNNAFQECSALTFITIPDSVTSIEMETFLACDNLTVITIPDSVTNVGDAAFAYCDSLSDVYYSGSEEEWNYITIGSENERLYDSDVTIHYNHDASTGPSNHLKWSLTDEGVLTLNGSGLMGLDDTTPAPWLEYSDKIKEVVIEDGILEIGELAFENCTSLIAVKIPNSVRQIGDGAFKNCTALTSIIIPNGITTLPSEVFYGCNSLKEIHIPRSLTLIKDNSLYGCKSMTDCYYGGTISDSDSISYSWLGIAGADSETLNALVIMNWHYLDETYYKDIDENIYEHLVILYNDEYYYGNSQTVPIINDYRNMAIADPSVNSYKFWKNASDMIDGDFNEEQYNEKMTVEAVIAEIFFNEQLNAAFNKNAEQAALEAQIAFLQILKDNAMELGVSDEQCSWIDTVLSTPEFIENSKISSILEQIPRHKVSILFNAIAKWYKNWKETIDFVGTAFGIFQISYEGLKDSIENVEQLYNLYLACVVYHTSNVQFQQAVTFMSDSIRNEIAKYTGDDDFSKRMRRVGNLYLEYYAVMLDESMTAYNNFAASITSDVLLGTGIELIVFSIKTIAKLVFPGLAAAEFVLDFGVFIWEQRSNIDEQAFARDKFLNMTLFYDSFYNALYSNEGFFGLLLKNPNTESYNTLLIGIQMHQTVESILVDYAIDYSVLLREEVEKCYKFSHNDHAWAFLSVMCGTRYGEPDGFIESLTWADKAFKRLRDDMPQDLVRLKEFRDTHKAEGAIVAGVSAIYAVQCPVDITVYRENEVVAKVENDVITQNCNDVFLRLYHLNDDKYAHKYLMLPDGYSIKVTGYAEGTMSFEKFIVKNNLITEISNIEEIPVTAGSVYNEVIEENKTVALECDLDNDGVIDQTVNVIEKVDAMLGDVNEDGSVDSSDASLVLAEYAKIQTGGAGEFTETQHKAADVNKDDVVDSSDASKILSYYAMISTGKEPTWD